MPNHDGTTEYPTFAEWLAITSGDREVQARVEARRLAILGPKILLENPLLSEQPQVEFASNSQALGPIAKILHFPSLKLR